MPTGVGPNEYILDEATKDIKTTAKKTLADYLSARTNGGAETFAPPVQGGGDYTYMPPRTNQFPIAPGSTEIPADASYRSPESTQRVFASESDLAGYASNVDMRNLVKVTPSAERSTNSGQSGNYVLEQAATVNTPTKATINSVLSKNRFSSGDNKFTAKSYAEAMPPSPVLMNQKGEKVTEKMNVYEAMRKASMMSMLNAAGGTTGPGSSGTLTISDIANDGPSYNDVISPLNSSQLGIQKIDAVNTRVAAEREPIPAPGGGLTFIDTDTNSSSAVDLETAHNSVDIEQAAEARYTKKSFGQLNTYLEQFSGAGTGNIILLAVTAYVALFIATAVVSLVLSLIIGKLNRPNPTSSNLPLGAERGPDFGAFFFDADGLSGVSLTEVLSVVGNLVSKILGVMQPYDGAPGLSYFYAALEGALSIIGVDIDAIAGDGMSALTQSLPKVLINFGLTPGYYITIIREISRDLSILTSGDTQFAGTMGIFEAIRSLKILRFVDTCARLGIINRKAAESDRSIDEDEPAGKSIAGGSYNSPAGLLTNSYDVAQKRISRSRETAGSKRLSWAHSSLGYTRSEIVTPDLMRAISKQSVSGLNDSDSKTSLGELKRLKARKIFSKTGRIEPAQRIYHEQLLDAEYMPFYFHDVRTNEILSFHAFLSDLSDAYSSNYTSVDGFGRMDPIQIYKNTTRAISFSFSVVATSPEDHENMWYSVNKLVNMVYPQWSEGDSVGDGTTNKYTQPFSQTIASSPMLRVRIGDVIHSNYSRFSLGRIFGLDKEDAKIKGSSTNALVNYEPATNAGPKDSPELQKASPAVKIQAQTNTNNLNFIQDISCPNDIASVSAKTIAAKVSPAKVALKPGRYDFYLVDPALSAGAQTPKKYRSKKCDAIIVSYVLAEKSAAINPTSYVVVDVGPDAPHFEVDGIAVPYSYAVVPTDALSSIEAESLGLAAVAPAETADPTAEFMNPANNAIVKSFEDGAGGRGLAGFITSLGLAYGSTEITWNVERGSRAPNVVNISISFTPIHDIPMGLASDGSARSVAYPVGDLTRTLYQPDLAQQDANMSTALAGAGVVIKQGKK